MTKTDHFSVTLLYGYACNHVGTILALVSPQDSILKQIQAGNGGEEKHDEESDARSEKTLELGESSPPRRARNRTSPSSSERRGGQHSDRDLGASGIRGLPQISYSPSLSESASG